MEIRITTNHILKVLLLITWIIFIGLCVEAGAIIVNTFITLFINPDAVKNFGKVPTYWQFISLIPIILQCLQS